MMYLQSLFEIFTYCVDPVHLSLKVIKLLLKPFAPANQFLDLPARADNDHHKKQAATFSPVGAKKKKSSEILLNTIFWAVVNCVGVFDS